MAEIKPCNKCGVVPEMLRSHSRRIISHTCYTFSTGWGPKSTVIDKWNSSNSQSTKEDSPSASDNSDYEAALWEKLLEIGQKNGLLDNEPSVELNKQRLNAALKAVRHFS